jgi:hypothetical protein
VGKIRGKFVCLSSVQHSRFFSDQVNLLLVVSMPLTFLGCRSYLSDVLKRAGDWRSAVRVTLRLACRLDGDGCGSKCSVGNAKAGRILLL